MTKHQQVTELLTFIEDEMRATGVWQAQPPAPEAFDSTEPFAVDTMDAHEWLQWILIPRMYALIEQGAALPSSFLITPYFEEFYRDDAEAARYLALLTHLRTLDGLFA